MTNYLQFIRQQWPLLGFGFVTVFWGNLGQSFFISWFGASIQQSFAISAANYGLLYAVATLCSGLLIMALGAHIDRLPSTDWLPPLILYYDRFGYKRIQEFLVKLDNQLSSDWIAQYSPTARMERMSEIMRATESAEKSDDLLDTINPFKMDQEGFSRAAAAAVYGRRFTRYLLLKLDYLYADHSQRMSLDFLSVEHLLPQNPKADSQWRKDFSDQQREEWTHRLGNLVLISTKKNTSQGNLDYAEKKDRYFQKRISTCPNSLRTLQNTQWTPVELEKNHFAVLAKLHHHYGFDVVKK